MEHAERETRPDGDGVTALFTAELRERIRRRIARRFRDPGTVDDLTQDVLVRLLRAVRRYARPDLGLSEGFVSRVTHDLLVDHVRSLARRRSIDHASHLCELFARPQQRHNPLPIHRQLLIELRQNLWPRLRVAQRRLLAAYLDDDIASISALSAHLMMDASNVRRVARSIGAKVSRTLLERLEPGSSGVQSRHRFL